MRRPWTALLIAALLLFGCVSSTSAQQPPLSEPAAATGSEPSVTRLFFAPTGRALQRGEGYFGAFALVLAPFFQVGVTDRISVGAGTIPFIITDSGGPPVWVTPKIQLARRESTSVAAGVVHFANIGDGHFGFAYLVMTRGRPGHAFTANVGCAYSRYSDSVRGVMVGMIGGEEQLSEHVTFISENHLFPGPSLLAMNGVRRQGEHFAVDFVILTFVSEGSFLPTGPLINFTWRF